ncbi:hypothetical protein Tco_0833392 [Tanacetum coccineum]
MVEPEKPLKKKDQIMFDKEVAQKHQAQLDAELEEEEKFARQGEEAANIAKEQGELTIKEKSRLFVELMNKRKKHFARLRVEEQRIKPPIKAQKRNTISTYLKNMAGYKHNQLNTKSFEDIQMLFDKEMKRVNTFVDMDTELVKGSETRTEGTSKRAGEELESKNFKKQKSDENVYAKRYLITLGRHLEEIHVTWAHLKKKWTRLRLYTKSFKETVHTERGDGITITKRRRQDFHIDSITDLATPSERSRLKVDLES